jgi:hypothetical protein
MMDSYVGISVPQRYTLIYSKGSKAVVGYDIKQDNNVHLLGTGQEFTNLHYMKADGKTFYATNVGSGERSVLKKTYSS